MRAFSLAKHIKVMVNNGASASTGFSVGEDGALSVWRTST